MGSEERKGVHPRGMTSAHADWHLQAQLEDDQLSLGAVLRRINPRPHHFCAPRCETRRCRKPVAISPELGQRIRDFPQQAFPLRREMKMFLGKRTPWSTGGHEAWAYEWPPCLLPYACVTFDKAQAFPVPCFPYLPIFIKSAFRIMWQRSEIIKLKLSTKF